MSIIKVGILVVSPENFGVTSDIKHAYVDADIVADRARVGGLVS